MRVFWNQHPKAIQTIPSGSLDQSRLLPPIVHVCYQKRDRWYLRYIMQWIVLGLVSW